MEDNNEAKVNEHGEVKHEERRIDPSVNQEGRADPKVQTKSNPELTTKSHSLCDGQDCIHARRIGPPFSALEGVRLLPAIRFLDSPSLGILESLTRSFGHQRIIDSLQRAVASSLSSLFAGVTQELTRNIRFADPPRSVLDQIHIPSLTRGIGLDLESILSPIVSPIPPLVHPKARMAAKLGWVVHHTLPIALLEDEDIETLDQTILSHYRERWDEVRKEMEVATSCYLVDRDSKEAMFQSLEAHERGLYRLVPRTMLAEIERATRVQLHKSIAGHGLNVKEKILREAGDLPISSLQDLSSGMILYEVFERHLYERIDDEDDRSRFVEDAIPNRHATVHGLVPYASEKSSLNAIFLADFGFFVITQIKMEKIREAVKVLEGHVLVESSRRHRGNSHSVKDESTGCLSPSSPSRVR